MLKNFWLSQFNNGFYYGRKIWVCYWLHCLALVSEGWSGQFFGAC